DYSRLGVPFYWIVDPQLGSVKVFERRRDGRNMVALSATKGRAAVPGCPALTLDLDALGPGSTRRCAHGSLDADGPGALGGAVLHGSRIAARVVAGALVLCAPLVSRASDVTECGQVLRAGEVGELRVSLRCTPAETPQLVGARGV